MVIQPEVLLLLRVVFAILVFFVVVVVIPNEVQLYVELSWNFGGDCIESVDCFRQMVIFIIFTLPIHKHRRYLHLLQFLS